MIAGIAIVVARVALTVALVCTMLFQIRYRRDRRSPEAHQVRAIALWAVAVAVVALVAFYFVDW